MAATMRTADRAIRRGAKQGGQFSQACGCAASGTAREQFRGGPYWFRSAQRAASGEVCVTLCVTLERRVDLVQAALVDRVGVCLDHLRDRPFRPPGLRADRRVREPQADLQIPGAVVLRARVEVAVDPAAGTHLLP